MRRLCAIAILLIGTAAAHAQWRILDSGSTADLRGIDNVGSGVAWASGTNGTVLRTTNDGATWTRCATPPDAGKLDFRGVQAFDAETAIVMSSGKGDLSRLYKTVDGCKSWKLVFSNPDAPEGFWDAVHFKNPTEYPVGEASGVILGDPVGGSFVIEYTEDGGTTWKREKLPAALPDEGAFAASNSSLLVIWEDGIEQFGSGGPEGARLYTSCDPCTRKPFDKDEWYAQPISMFGSGSSIGVFSIAEGFIGSKPGYVAVGGDYAKPEIQGVAAFSAKWLQWHPALTPPHGYRSAVAYDPATKTWITVGPNGTDISTDDGRNWRALHPNPALNETPDADRNWNALSLPFVAGPHGRIGKLDPDAIQRPDNSK